MESKTGSGAVGFVQVGDGDASDPRLGSPVGGEGADLREVSSVHGPGPGARMLLLAPGSQHTTPVTVWSSSCAWCSELSMSYI